MGPGHLVLTQSMLNVIVEGCTVAPTYLDKTNVNYYDVIDLQGLTTRLAMSSLPLSSRHQRLQKVCTVAGLMMTSVQEIRYVTSDIFGTICVQHGKFSIMLIMIIIFI